MTIPYCKNEFNPKKIKFPSDSISLGQIRNEELYPYTAEKLSEAAAVHIPAFEMHKRELQLAEDAYCGELGMQIRYGERNVAIEILNQFYHKYGISTGMAQTRLLVSDFEHAAGDQALEFKGIRSR